jgi:hypothetical protein
MQKTYTVSADIILPVMVEIVAESEDDAIDKLHLISPTDLLKLADKDEGAIIVANESAYEV